MGHRLAYIVSAVLLTSAGATAQSFPDPQFNHITTADGLSSNSATCVTEDKQGFIWIGTDNGLNRWDGYRMKQYFHRDEDSSSLVSNETKSLHCDEKGRLWITTSGGVSCFLPDRNIFVNYSVDQPNPRKLKNNNAVLVTENHDSAIWITSQKNVIYRVNEDMSLQETVIRTAPFTFQNIIKEGYDYMMTDSKGNKWAYCANRVYLLDPHTRQPIQTYDLSTQLGYSSFSSMIEGSGGCYWVGSSGKIPWKFDPRAGALKPISTLELTNLLEWRYNDHSWMVAAGLYTGVYLFNSTGVSMKKLTGLPSDPFSLAGTAFFSLHTDKEHNLWICSNEGVNYTQSARNIFEIIPITDPNTPNYDPRTTEIPYSYFEDGDDIWLSKRYKSTFLYDTNFHVKKFYTSLYPLSATTNRWRLNAYYFFRRGADLFISTDSGLVAYDLAHSTSRLYLPREKMKEPSFRTIVALDSSQILIRTVGEGLFVFNTVTKTFTRHITSHDSATGDLPSRLNYLLKTSRGDLFLSSDEGRSLIRYDSAKARWRVVRPLNEDTFHLLSTPVFGMEEDPQGRIWLASSNGLFIYHPEKNTIEQRFTNDGKMGLLFRICFDNYGNAWMNGNSGIWCYLTAKNKWIHFNGQDGLPDKDFGGIIARRANGDILAGLHGAIAVFHPSQLYTVNNDPPSVITEASAGDRSRLFPLLKGIDKKLDLPSGQNSFSIDFAVLNYHDAPSIRYLYKLEPLMKDFKSNSDGHINFNGLMPGHYVLHVKGGTKAGDAYTKEDTMDIDIAPSWYQLWEFRLAVFLLLAALIIYMVRRRIASIRKESALREKIIETEMQALRAQMDPHFIFNSLSSIENFIMQNEKRLASDYLNKFARLIRMILDSSRNELVTLAKDMEALQLYIDLEQISCNNKFTYKAIIDPILLNEDYHVPPLLIQPYVENAIVHGLMPSRSDDLSLTVIARLESDHVRYIIEDNGVGRQQAQQYKQKNKPYHKSVGMKITEERIHIFNRQTGSNGSVVITDLYDEKKKPLGTRIEITIKAM